MSSTHNDKESFAAKILLFGEYTLMVGSKGLAFPFDAYQGRFDKSENPESVHQHFRLNDFCHYLQGSSILSKHIDLARFENDIQQGVYFNSNIPHGYGIGSSGALCAAVYARYAHDFERKDQYTTEELKLLKDMMALMEGYYHGASSGLDCLISLVDRPVLIHERNVFETIDYPDLNSLGKFYLYDSGMSRKTLASVHQFLEKYETGGKYKTDTDQLTEVVNQIIGDAIDQNRKSFKSHFYELSRFQYLHFAELIPEHIKEIWFAGLETQKYLFKLCGAGAGGFFLVYSDDDEYNQNCDYMGIN